MNYCLKFRILKSKLGYNTIVNGKCSGITINCSKEGRKNTDNVTQIWNY